jgi:uncharacterized protein
MRLLPMILAATVFLGCQTTPPDYRALTERFDAGEEVSPKRVREAFLRASDLPARMERLNDLEAQALAVVDDEALKLGSIGSAILDTYIGSLTGHFVLSRFYDYVSNPKAEFHREWVERIQADMEEAGDGTRERPYPAVTPAEGRMYALSKGLTAVGSIYQSDPDLDNFQLLLQARPESGPLQDLVFDLTPLYDSMRQEFAAAARSTPKKSKQPEGAGDADPASDFSPFTLIGYLAKQNDTAAQTAVGAYLAWRKQFAEAVDWLRAASRTGNLLANSLLASVFLEQAKEAENDEEREQALDQAMENYLHAIALGSADAMYSLGVLYLNGQYGEENKVAGLPLLKQAAELDHSDATTFLAHLHYAGDFVDKNLNAARALYSEAAAEGNAYARKSYARFLLDREADQQGDPLALEWLEELAEDGDAESMLLLGNLHARGVGTRQSVRRAVRYYEDAVEQEPADANIVNEVAWTLAVSDQRRLRRERYAREIMDHLMETNSEARQRPEYLDTWAATYAATGEFDRAVEVQQQAVDAAREANYEAVLEILLEHLEAFGSGETVSEAVP